MRIPVDVATGTEPPTYTQEVFQRLPPDFDARLIRSRGYAATSVGKVYRLLHHPLAVRRSRRRGGILHVDTQLLAYLLSLPMGPRTVITCHDLAPFHPELDDPSYVSRERVLDGITLRLIRRGLLRAGWVVTVSRAVGDELASFGRTRGVDVVPMGVDLDRFRPRPLAECRVALERYGIHGDGPLVLFVGSEHPRKNVPGLLRAFARIRDPKVRLVKVGAPRHPHREDLLRLVRSLDLDRRVVFLDRVQADDLPFLYGAASVVVLPSFYEGFGLPPLEAMACGVPVAASDTPSIREVCGDAIAYFDPHDEAAITETLDSVLGQRDRQEELRARGLSRARLFPWSRTVQGLTRVYGRIAGT